MQAYTKGISKKEFVKEMKLHQKLDNFQKGTYGRGEIKACSVGCALKSVSKLKKIELDPGFHKEFEKHLGIPEWIARVDDTIFEGISTKRSKTWPVEFAQAINEGSNLDKIKAPFMIFILENSLLNFDHEKYPDVEKSINNVIELWKKYPKGPNFAESAAWSAARSAARSAAWSAAWSAAYEKFADKLLDLMRNCK